jgi:uncharacterized protein (TIGR03437 family)
VTLSRVPKVVVFHALFTLAAFGQIHHLAPTITTTSLSDALVDSDYAQNLIAIGGTPPYSWSIAEGSLPVGLTLSHTGALSGTTHAHGIFPITAKATDADGLTALQALRLVVAAAQLVINNPSNLPPAFVGVPYSQTLTATGGLPPYAWSILSGSLPTGITLSSAGAIAGTPTATGTSHLTVQAVDSTSSSQSAQFVLVVNPPPTVIVSPVSMSFAYNSDGSVIPSQSISVFNTSAASFTATATTPGGNWLSLSGASGTTPATFIVSADPTGLSPGTYSGRVTVNTPGASAPIVVPVMLNISAALPGVLQIAPSTLNISSQQGGSVAPQQVAVTNAGGGNLSFTAKSATQAGGNWLTLLTTSGVAAPGAPGIVSFSVSPGSLAPGTYSGSITVSSSGQTASELVVLTVNAKGSSILLSQTGLQFTTVANTVSPPAQSFSVTNPGQGVLNWTASTSTLSGGSGWLSVSPSSGSSQPLPATPTAAVVSVNSQNLAAGTYYGSVSISSPGVPNSPQVVAVQLNVLPAGQSLPPSVSEQGILLTAVYGGNNPAPQSISIFSPLAQSAPYTVTSLTYDGGAWFVPAPQATAIGVTSQLSLWPSGVRHGTMRAAFADGSVQAIDVLSVVAFPAAPTASSSFHRLDVATCPSRLILQSSNPGPTFSANAAQSVPISVMITDDCIHPLTNASNPSVIASFYDMSKPLGTRAQADLPLTYQGPGVWAGTWTPQTVSSQIQVLVSAVGEIGVLPVAGQFSMLGPVNKPGAGAPGIPTGVYNAASFQPGNTVASGSFVSIFGTNLGNGTNTPSDVPLPTLVAGTQVLLGNTPLPLQYVGSSQINALIPASIATNTPQQLIVQRDNTQAAATTVTVADSQPGIYTANQQGTGQGAVLNPDDSLAAPVGSAYAGSHPAMRGSNIEVFATGLGAVINAPPAGSPAPASPLATTVKTVTATVGGVSAPVTFSGLAPGFIGLYQVNVTVPASAPVGDAIPVTLIMDSAMSNTVTIAVQ